MAKLILFNKPFGVLSQFRTDDNNDFATLSDYFNDKRLRVAGRLDATSEGLLLLTDDGHVNQALTHPPTTPNHKKQGKTYWVQLDGTATDEQIERLRQGVVLKDGLTLPAIVERLPDNTHDTLWQAPDGISKRKITSWLSITIVEGKNRQVRRMTAHVGLPCLRLVRIASSGFELGKLAVGEYREMVLDKADLLRLGVKCQPLVNMPLINTLSNPVPKNAKQPQKNVTKPLKLPKIKRDFLGKNPRKSDN